jgi:hypothetical protein
MVEMSRLQVLDTCFCGSTELDVSTFRGGRCSVDGRGLCDIPLYVAVATGWECQIEGVESLVADFLTETPTSLLLVDCYTINAYIANKYCVSGRMLINNICH